MDPLVFQLSNVQQFFQGNSSHQLSKNIVSMYSAISITVLVVLVLHTVVMIIITGNWKVIPNVTFT